MKERIFTHKIPDSAKAIPGFPGYYMLPDFTILGKQGNALKPRRVYTLSVCGHITTSTWMNLVARTILKNFNPSIHRVIPRDGNPMNVRPNNIVLVTGTSRIFWKVIELVGADPLEYVKLSRNEKSSFRWMKFNKWVEREAQRRVGSKLWREMSHAKRFEARTRVKKELFTGKISLDDIKNREKKNDTRN